MAPFCVGKNENKLTYIRMSNEPHVRQDFHSDHRGAGSTEAPSFSNQTQVSGRQRFLSWLQFELFDLSINGDVMILKYGIIVNVNYCVPPIYFFGCTQ